MKVLIAYYSKGGKTRRACEILAKELQRGGAEVDLFFLKPKKDYSFPLLNPRAYKETFSGECELEKLPGGDYDLVIFASPIWYDHVTAPVMKCAKELKGKVKRVAALVTSARGKKYDKMFEEKLRSLGYEVIASCDLIRIEEGKIREFAERILSSPG